MRVFERVLFHFSTQQIYFECNLANKLSLWEIKLAGFVTCSLIGLTDR
jgi:hypothetical protein